MRFRRIFTEFFNTINHYEDTFHDHFRQKLFAEHNAALVLILLTNSRDIPVFAKYHCYSLGNNLKSPGFENYRLTVQNWKMEKQLVQIDCP